MNGLDYFILFLLGGMAVAAATRGILREMVGLLSLMTAVFVAFTFSGALQPLFASYLGHEFGASLAAFGLIFMATLFACGFLGRFLQFAAGAAGLSHLDRGLGFLFGLTKGSVLVLVGFALLLAANVKTPTLVSQSLLSPYCIEATHRAGGLLSSESSIVRWVERGYRDYHATAGRVPLWRETPVTAKEEEQEGLLGELRLDDRAGLTTSATEEDLTALLSEMQGGKDPTAQAKALPEEPPRAPGTPATARVESWLHARLKSMNRESAGLVGWLLGAPEPTAREGVQPNVERRSGWEDAVKHRLTSGLSPRIEKAEAIDALLGQLDKEVN